MIQWWSETPIWQRVILFGLMIVLFVLGMHAWVWSALDSSIAVLTQDLETLNQKSQESIQRMRLLKDVEQEVAMLREKLAPILQQVPVKIEPQVFRRDVVNIGKRMRVAVRLWKPKTSLRGENQSDIPLDIDVRVEGNFYDTVQFLDEILQLSWIQTVNPLVLIRKQAVDTSSLVTTEFTIKGLSSEQFQQTKEMLKT